MVPDAGVSELILPVCDQLGEDDLAAALGRLAARPEQLSVVQLGFCGHGLTPAVAALLHPCVPQPAHAAPRRLPLDRRAHGAVRGAARGAAAERQLAAGGAGPRGARRSLRPAGSR